MQLTIAICTAHRPKLLASLLEALGDSSGTRWSTEILVVDNAPDASAHAVVAGFPGVRYVSEPCPNISLARNRALAEARGELLLFLDDDQWVDAGFRASLERAWAHRPAGSRGLRLEVAPRFDADVPARFRWAALFSAVRRLPEGSRVRRTDFATNGVLFERAAVVGVPFDPYLGTRGSEDTEWFLRLQDAGVLVTGTHLAVVYERISSERASYQRLIRTSFRIGFTDALLAERYGRVGPGVTRSATVVYLGLRLAVFPLALPRGHLKSTHHLLNIARELGKLFAFAGFDWQAYSASAPSKPVREP